MTKEKTMTDEEFVAVCAADFITINDLQTDPEDVVELFVAKTVSDYKSSNQLLQVPDPIVAQIESEIRAWMNEEQPVS